MRSYRVEFDYTDDLAIHVRRQALKRHARAGWPFAALALVLAIYLGRSEHEVLAGMFVAGVLCCFLYPLFGWYHTKDEISEIFAGLQNRRTIVTLRDEDFRVEGDGYDCAYSWRFVARFTRTSKAWLLTFYGDPQVVVVPTDVLPPEAEEFLASKAARANVPPNSA